MKFTATALAAAILSVTLAYGQDNGALTPIVSALQKHGARQAVEKVHLHLDKPYYAAGDDIWFKAYLTTGSDHQPSTISKVLNVALVDDKKHITKLIKLPIVHGVTWGDIALPDTLAEGTYRLMAYTNWMRNEGNYYDEPLVIGNGITNTVIVRSAFDRSIQNGKPATQITLTYTDLKQKPIAGRTVSYQFRSKLKTLGKGTSVTDQNGQIRVSYTRTDDKTPMPDMIRTELSLNAREGIYKNITINAISGNADVQFFPESGQLVSGINTKVAFKAIGTDGLGTDISGTVIDNDGKEICKFTTRHAGMGLFNLNAEPGKSYTARVTYKDGSVQAIPLPKATDNGYMLSVNTSSDDHISVRISTNGATLQQDPNRELYVVAQAQYHVYYAAKVSMQSPVAIVNIPRDRFRTGIVQFTLFAGNKPVNERLAFVKTNDQLKLAINTDKQTYHSREKVKLALTSKNVDSLVRGNFSVSVIDESKVGFDEDDERTILTDLLLISDLKGYVEKPNYYFRQDNEQTQADLDLLMLTQGYRKFNWDKVLSNDQQAMAFQPDTALKITGKILTNWDKPVVKGKVTLLAKESGAVADTTTDEHGQFRFDGLLFPDSTKFVVQARTPKNGDKVQVKLDNEPYQQIIEEAAVPFYTDASLSVSGDKAFTGYLQNSRENYDQDIRFNLGKHTRMLSEVVIKAKKIEKQLQYSANLNGPGKADQIVLAEELEHGGGMLSDVLRGRLNGVIFQGDKPVSVSNSAASLTASGGRGMVDMQPMVVILDGTLTDYTRLRTLNPLDIGSIEVLRTPVYLSVYGSRAGTGALVITTKHGEVTAYQTPGIVTYLPLGYYVSREFYSPKYDVGSDQKQQADLRSTIYWGPNITTNKAGNADITYFNADGRGTYRVVVEGLDDDGNLGRQVYRYKVE